MKYTREFSRFWGKNKNKKNKQKNHLSFEDLLGYRWMGAVLALACEVRGEEGEEGRQSVEWEEEEVLLVVSCPHGMTVEVAPGQRIS